MLQGHIPLRYFLKKAMLAALIYGSLGCLKNSNGSAPWQKSHASELSNVQVPASKSQFFIHKLAQTFFNEATVQLKAIHGLNERKNTADLLLKTIKNIEGLPRLQIQLLFDEMFKQNSPARVEQILGLKPFEVPFFLDDLYWEISEDRNLQAPCQSPSRLLFLASLKRPESDGPMPKPRRPWQVVYQAVKGLQRTGIQFGADSSLLTLNFYPKDLRRARNIRCRGDVCEGEFVAPFQAGVNVPLGLLAYVSVKYSRSKQLASNPQNRVEHSVWLSQGITPIDLFGIISVTIDLSFEILQIRDHPDEGPAPDPQTKVVCYGSISCDTPLFSVMASVDPKGFEFMSYMNVAGLGTDMAMIYPVLPSAYKRVEFPSWAQEKMAKVRERLVKKSFGPITPIHHDVYWNAFVGLPIPQETETRVGN